MPRPPISAAMDQRSFVRFAALFEVGLAVLAVALGAVVGVRPENLSADARPTAVGVAATAPLIAFYLIATRVRWAPLRRIHELLITTLGQPLAQCRWQELALLAALAGICEELLFRGVLQPWIGSLGIAAGWIGANLLFGIAHAVTPTYFFLASAIGFYLSGVQAAAGGSLVAPILAHGLYDWYAFVRISAEYRRRDSDGAVVAAEEEGTADSDETG